MWKYFQKSLPRLEHQDIPPKNPQSTPPHGPHRPSHAAHTCTARPKPHHHPSKRNGHPSKLLATSRFQGDFARDVPVSGTAGAFLGKFARDVPVAGTAGAVLSDFARDVPVSGTARAVFRRLCSRRPGFRDGRSGCGVCGANIGRCGANIGTCGVDVGVWSGCWSHAVR